MLKKQLKTCWPRRADAGNAWGWQFLGRLQFEQERWDEAEESLMYSAELEQGHSAIWHRLGELFVTVRNLEEATEARRAPSASGAASAPSPAHSAAVPRHAAPTPPAGAAGGWMHAVRCLLESPQAHLPCAAGGGIALGAVLCVISILTAPAVSRPADGAPSLAQCLSKAVTLNDANLGAHPCFAGWAP